MLHLIIDSLWRILMPCLSLLQCILHVHLSLF